jgi:hypothetical protein
MGSVIRDQRLRGRKKEVNVKLPKVLSLKTFSLKYI